MWCNNPDRDCGIEGTLSPLGHICCRVPGNIIHRTRDGRLLSSPDICRPFKIGPILAADPVPCGRRSFVRDVIGERRLGGGNALQGTRARDEREPGYAECGPLGTVGSRWKISSI